MSESGAFSLRAGTAIHPQGFKLIEGVYPLKGESRGGKAVGIGPDRASRGVDGFHFLGLFSNPFDF